MMNSNDMELLKEGLKFADDAMARLMEVDNEHVQHLAKMLHAVLWFGEILVERFK